MKNTAVLRRVISACAAVCCLAGSLTFSTAAYSDTAAVNETEIVSAAASDRFKVSPTLCNPNATAETKELMKFITDNYGKFVISGQSADRGGYTSPEFKAITEQTGKVPAMLGMDLYRYTPVRVAHGDTSDTVEKAEKFYKRGGIVQLYWHWNAPEKYYKSGKDSSGNPRWYGGFYTDNIDMNKFDLADIMSGRDQEGYDQLMADIDAIAVQLKKLQDAGVPVLFRPLHEASGNYGLYNGTGQAWFWWGTSGPEVYKDLYKTLYDRLTNVHELNNLIWVWNGQRADWYPGDEYVDIIGEDIYPGKNVHTPQSARFEKALEYTDTNKVIAMTENGCLFDTEEAISSGNPWSFFCTWGGEFCVSGGKISEQYSKKAIWNKVYNSPKTLTLEDMPRHKHVFYDEKLYPDKTKVVAPTYTSEGYTEHTCMTCNAKVKDNIKPKKKLGTTSVTSFTPASTAVTLKWKKVSGASGYYVYKYNSSTKKYSLAKKVSGGSTVSAKMTGLASGTTYKFKVQPYVVQSGKTVKGSLSNYRTVVTKPAKSAITKLSPSRTAVTVKWKKVRCTGYKIQKYVSSSKKWVTAKTVSGSKTSVKITGLSKNRTYKYRIVAYKKLSGKVYYGSPSSAKTFKTKK